MYRGERTEAERKLGVTAMEVRRHARRAEAVAQLRAAVKSAHQAFAEDYTQNQEFMDILREVLGEYDVVVGWESC